MQKDDWLSLLPGILKRHCVGQGQQRNLPSLGTDVGDAQGRGNRVQRDDHAVGCSQVPDKKSNQRGVPFSFDSPRALAVQFSFEKVSLGRSKSSPSRPLTIVFKHKANYGPRDGGLSAYL